MEALRKLHNACKRDLISEWVKPHSHVLDCGCGRGGDLWKWRAVHARVSAIDPDPASLLEAEERAQSMDATVLFLGPGDIRQAAFAGPYDVVCYNFSLHYIVDSFAESLKALALAVRPGGLLIGIVPELARAEAMVDADGSFKDALGNTIEILGDRLLVNLSDGPYYADGPKSEPLLDGAILIQNIELLGFERLMWEPMIRRPNGLISDLYTKFVFRKVWSR